MIVSVSRTSGKIKLTKKLKPVGFILKKPPPTIFRRDDHSNLPSININNK
jgi:hypothetical protein